MVKETRSKIYKVGSRHTIYLQKELVSDSAFPFKPNDEVVIKIENDRLAVEKAPSSRLKKN
jgi:hypothetical protein